MIIFRGARDARHTAHACTAQQKREAVVGVVVLALTHCYNAVRGHRTGSDNLMTDDGSQPPIEQLATAVHRGPATRSWCGPLLLVLLGGVVML